MSGHEIDVVEVGVPGPRGPGGGTGDVAHIATTIRFDTPGLSAPSGAIPGVVIYTPTVGDILLDAWVDVDPDYEGKAWDATAKGDLYLASTAGASGFLGVWGEWNGSGALDMTGNGGVSPNLFNGDTGIVLTGPGVQHEPTLLELNLANAIGGSDFTQQRRLVPGRFTAAEPIVFVVSSNGTSTGNDPGATQGKATVHLLVIPAGS